MFTSIRLRLPPSTGRRIYLHMRRKRLKAAVQRFVLQLHGAQAGLLVEHRACMRGAVIWNTDKPKIISPCCHLVYITSYQERRIEFGSDYILLFLLFDCQVK